MTCLAPVLGLLAGLVGIADTIPLCPRHGWRQHPVYFCLVNGAIVVLIHHRRSLLASLRGTPSPARSLG